MDINISCSTGQKLKVKDLSLYEKHLKKHSMLEINRMKDCIIEDGFLFPIVVQRYNNKNIIIDGECRFQALSQIDAELEIPVVYVRGDIEKNILMSATTNHCVMRQSAIDFAKDSNTDIKKYAFPEGQLIDFYTVDDIDRYFEAIPVKNKKESQAQYFGLLAQGDL